MISLAQAVIGLSVNWSPHINPTHKECAEQETFVTERPRSPMAASGVPVKWTTGLPAVPARFAPSRMGPVADRCGRRESPWEFIVWSVVGRSRPLGSFVYDAISSKVVIDKGRNS
jgi:hypothetical protein